MKSMPETIEKEEQSPVTPTKLRGEAAGSQQHSPGRSTISRLEATADCDSLDYLEVGKTDRGVHFVT